MVAPKRLSVSGSKKLGHDARSISFRDLRVRRLVDPRMNRAAFLKVFVSAAAVNTRVGEPVQSLLLTSSFVTHTRGDNVF